MITSQRFMRTKQKIFSFEFGFVLPTYVAHILSFYGIALLYRVSKKKLIPFKFKLAANFITEL